MLPGRSYKLSRMAFLIWLILVSSPPESIANTSVTREWFGGGLQWGMRILLGAPTRHVPECALLLAMVFFGVLLAVGPMPALGQTSPSTTSDAGNPDRLPITTSSPEAAELFAEGLRFSHGIHAEQALGKWREATRKDPNFAQAWVSIIWLTSDPVEAKQAAEKAQLASPHVTPGEELLVKWTISSYTGRFVDGIAAINDLLAMYPRDTELNFEAGLWLFFQGEYQASVKVLKRALAVDPNFTAALNIMGYDLAAMHQYDQAISYLKRYAETEPNEPNPHDTLAEVLQQAGRLEASLAEYREALKLDPTFYASHWGFGNDYALLGKQDRAREEYAKAPRTMAFSPGLGLKCQTQSAITYAREGNVTQTRVQLAAVLEEATKLQINDCRSLIQQDLALLAESHAVAFQHLDQAEAVLLGSEAMSEADRSEMLVRTLRIRARLAAEAGEFEIARATVARLQKMFRDNPSNEVERAYNGANGALLAAESKIGAAIEALQEDPEDPFSLAKLAELQAALGNAQDAQDAAEIRERLKADYGTDLEDWLVVRRFRP
jgi:tetratricopeptide (TPR) repeat protein